MTTEQIVVEPKANQIDTWLYLKRRFVAERGSDADKNRKAVPRTTNRDVMQLANYWDRAMRQADAWSVFKPNRDLTSRKRWDDAKTRIDVHMRSADPSAVYPENEWFWQEETARAAAYLDALAFIPSRFELLSEAVGETIEERKRDIARALDEPEELLGSIKKGALIVGGLVAAALVVPRIFRVFSGRGD